VIYPKGEDTWKNYLVNSFKDGEIVVTGLGNIAIVRDEIVDNNYKTYCVFYKNDARILTTGDTVNAKRLATYAERELLFQALVDNGNIWNPETKSVERLENDDCFKERGINMERSEEMWDAVEKEHGPLSMREAFVTLAAMQWADKTMIEKLEKWLEHIAEYTGHDLETIKESLNSFINGND
jgi:hypothetical protein